MGEDSVQHYRKLVGGGAICLVRDGKAWTWRYRSFVNTQNTSKGTVQDWPESTFSTVEEMASAIARKIDYPDYVLNTLPVPRRREAVMATRAKL